MSVNKQRLLTLSGYLVGLAAVMLQACIETKETDCGKLCGNWVSVQGKPDVLIYREGDAYKVTVFKRRGIRCRLKPETYLLREEEGNLFINTGYRIDIAYNEATDVLTFSPHGDYTRASEKQSRPLNP